MWFLHWDNLKNSIQKDTKNNSSWKVQRQPAWLNQTGIREENTIFQQVKAFSDLETSKVRNLWMFKRCLDMRLFQQKDFFRRRIPILFKTELKNRRSPNNDANSAWIIQRGWFPEPYNKQQCPGSVEVLSCFLGWLGRTPWNLHFRELQFASFKLHNQ